MHNLANDVRGGFNSHVADMRKEKKLNGGRYRYTVTVFDTRFIPLCVNAKLKDVPEMTQDNYEPAGMTALLDAVGKTIVEFEAATTLGPDDKVLLVIQTDGAENSSREFGLDRVKAMLEEREATGKWSINYIGHGLHSWGDHGLGTSVSTVHTGNSAADTRSAYKGMTLGASRYGQGKVQARNVSGLIVPDAGGLSTTSSVSRTRATSDRDSTKQ
jgi:hypothetical protein